jgi:arginase family enzyme
MSGPTFLESSGVLHSGPATFFGLELETAPSAPTRMALVGAPWDEGNGGRHGANYGPRGVRDASSWFTSYDVRARRDVFEALPAVDGGDLPCFPADAAATSGHLADGTERLLRAGVTPLVVGGNHAITIGTAAGASRTLDGRMGYLSIDTHLDTAADWGGSRYGSGCPTYRACELDNVDPGNVVVYGAHGWLNPREHVETADELGVGWYSREEIHRRGLAETLDEAIARASEGVDGLYVTFDMDSIDSASAPGAGTPEAGGFVADEAIAIARRIGQANPFALDIVEIAPVYDPAGITPRLACHLILEMIGGLAEADAGEV